MSEERLRRIEERLDELDRRTAHLIQIGPGPARFAEHLRTLQKGNREEQQRAWEHLEEVLTEDGKL